MCEATDEPTAVYLQPGESFFALEQTIISTILGSCVSVTLWCERLRVGAMTHSQLPKCPKTSRVVSLAMGRRYVDFAIRELARRFDELGVERSQVQVKLFGGADVLRTKSHSTARATVGSLNCDKAIAVLEAEGFHVSASSLRGCVGRKIQFHTGTGDVLVRCLS